ncbi:uncharacterized protein UTRI_04344 [Ustilago trichophora]|uniref:Uncharacterized protein n=1 Tax=Ustilago trichophora TaxID=86804 RepID=A0A5C3ER26_9BASI|nr:uncharacterized protein UTRI_04344 [Ustilago trichophora]
MFGRPVPSYALSCSACQYDKFDRIALRLLANLKASDLTASMYSYTTDMICQPPFPIRGIDNDISRSEVHCDAAKGSGFSTELGIRKGKRGQQRSALASPLKIAALNFAEADATAYQEKMMKKEKEKEKKRKEKKNSRKSGGEDE